MKIAGVSEGGAAGLAVVILALVLAGCQATPNPGLNQPVLTPITQPSQNLRTLPPPKERIPVAVYDFPDLTGQYKDTQTVQTLSRAVTQGGAPMLIKALQDAGERRWFTVLDRARLDNLLKERQIATEMRRIYRNEEKINPKVLPPLDFAGIIMEGGIIGYDTNTMTGGIGARYLGIGADVKYQQDTVTVTLRALSTKTGEVLTSVTVHKSIASYGLQGGIFRYITLDSILEGEAGLTQNEPKQIAVQQAIEKAVRSIVIEGVELGVWHFADPAAGQEVIEAYNKEKYGQHMRLATAIVPPPETRDAADVIATVPVSRTAARKPAAPAANATAPAALPAGPPPPAQNERVGSLEPDKNPSVSAQAVTPERTDIGNETSAQRIALAHM